MGVFKNLKSIRMSADLFEKTAHGGYEVKKPRASAQGFF